MVISVAPENLGRMVFGPFCVETVWMSSGRRRDTGSGEPPNIVLSSSRSAGADNRFAEKNAIDLEATDLVADLVAIGEVLVEFSPAEMLSSDGPHWRASPAGDVLNTLVHAGRSGLSTRLLTRFGTDPFTGMILERISSAGVDLSAVQHDRERPNGLYFITLDDRGERSFHYRRGEAAARRLLCCGDAEFDALRARLLSSRILYLTGITLAVLEERQRLIELLREIDRRGAPIIAFDPNIRPVLWRSLDEMRETVEEILPLVDIFLPSIDDLRLLRVLDDRDDEDEIAPLISSLPPDHTLLKRGSRGATLYLGDEVRHVEVDRSAPVVDTTGAGDAMNAGYLAGLVCGRSSEEALALGLARAAEVVGHPGAINPALLKRGEE